MARRPARGSTCGDQCLQGRAASGLKQAASGMNRRHSSSVRGRATRAHKAAAMTCVWVVASLPLAGSPGASSRRAAGSSRRRKHLPHRVVDGGLCGIAGVVRCPAPRVHRQQGARSAGCCEGCGRRRYLISDKERAQETHATRNTRQLTRTLQSPQRMHILPQLSKKENR